MPRVASGATAVSKLIAGSPPGARRAMKAIRRVILSSAPGCEERISYGIPAVRYAGRFIAYYAAFKGHIGFFPPVRGTLRAAAARYAGPKGNLRFPLTRPMPLALIRRIIRSRVRALRPAGPARTSARRR